MTTNNFKPHPLSDVFPMSDEDSYRALVKDIKEHGLREPIMIFDGKILDGRNRLKACIEAGIEPETKEFKGDNPEDFVHSANINRRHLSKNWLAITAAEWTKNPPAGGVSKITTQAAAEKYGVPVRSVERAKRIVDAGSPSLISDVKLDKMSLSFAETIAKKMESKSEDEREENYKSGDAVKDIKTNARKNKADVFIANVPDGYVPLDLEGEAEDSKPEKTKTKVNKPESTEPRESEPNEENESYPYSMVEAHLRDIKESLSEMKQTLGSNALTVEHKAELGKLIVQAKDLSDVPEPEQDEAA